MIPNKPELQWDNRNTPKSAAFRDLAIGQTFDWINDAKPETNTFFRPCMKVSARKYRTIAGGPVLTMTVGTINATVYHIGEHE